MDIEKHFRSAIWKPVDSISRPFVKHANTMLSEGKIWQYSSDSMMINLSVLIPTVDAYRGGYFRKLLLQIGLQEMVGFEVIVIRGDKWQGRAINYGATIAKGKYILTLDDDTLLPDPLTFCKLVTLMEEHSEIGIAGGNNIIPSNANHLVRRIMQELPRRSWDPVESIKDSDLAEHPCMIMRTDEFKFIGGENELIPRGLDPYLRQEFRKIRKRVVVVPGVIYHHLPPCNFSKLLRQFYRNGRQAAYTNRNYPQWMIETPQRHGQFKVKQSFLFRICRFPICLLHALITGKPIWFLCEVFYALGFASECIASEKIS